MSSSKKIDQKRDIAASVYLSEAQNPISPPPPYWIPVYSILIHTGKGRGGGIVKPKRRLEEQQLRKLGRKYQYN
jgi:hypothetical protein